MELRKTDRRFKLYQFGFDCYVEFDMFDLQNYARYQRYCKITLGEQFLYFNDKIFQDGKYHLVSRHRKRNSYFKRIYFKGEKNHTLLLMMMPAKDMNYFYL